MKESGFKFLLALLALFILWDIGFTFYQSYHLPLDGDMPRIIAPAYWYSEVLQDPWGIRILNEHVQYGGAARFTCHAFERFWFFEVYRIFHLFIEDPVQAVFYCSASFSLLIQISLLILFYAFGRVGMEFSFRNFILITALAVSFFQYNGYYDCMGILDLSINYTFFYAFPLTLLAFYLYCLYKMTYTKDTPSFWVHIVLLPLAWILAFSSPLISPVVFIISMIYFGYTFLVKLKRSSHRPDRKVIWHILLFTLFCIYSFYISRFNVEQNQEMPLWERYKLLLKGLGFITSHTRAIPLLLCFIMLQWIILYRYNPVFWRKWKVLYLFLILFSIVYIFLLPLGGYRVYRPLIVRYDTFMPVTLIILFFVTHGMSGCLACLRGKFHIIYLSVVVFYIGWFTYADRKPVPKSGAYQKNIMQTIYSSPQKQIEININENFLSWDKKDFQDPEVSRVINHCLSHWRILTPDKQVSYHISESN